MQTKLEQLANAIGIPIADFKEIIREAAKDDPDTIWIKADVERYRAKWLEARKYLRAANKGARINAMALQLCSLRYSNLQKQFQDLLVATNETGPFKCGLGENTDCETEKQ